MRSQSHILVHSDHNGQNNLNQSEDDGNKHYKGGNNQRGAAAVADGNSDSLFANDLNLNRNRLSGTGGHSNYTKY